MAEFEIPSASQLFLTLRATRSYFSDFKWLFSYSNKIRWIVEQDEHLAIPDGAEKVRDLFLMREPLLNAAFSPYKDTRSASLLIMTAGRHFSSHHLTRNRWFIRIFGFKTLQMPRLTCPLAIKKVRSLSPISKSDIICRRVYWICSVNSIENRTRSGLPFV